MIEEKNFNKVKRLVDSGRWVGPLLYYQQWNGTDVDTLNTYIT